MDSSEMKAKIRPDAGRILIVDDEEIVHLTLKRLLEPEGYTVNSTYGGKETLERLDAGYDLLILDIRMPDIDGIEVLREIGKRELDIEVLMLTGYATMESATQALNYGARGYLMKPIENVPEFRTRVGEAVHIAQLARENRQFYDAIVSGQVDSITIDGKVYQVPTLRQENKEIFQRLMEVIRHAVVLLDFDGNITFANVNFAQMVGESYQNLIGARFEPYMVEEDQDKLIDAFTRLSTGQVAVSIPAQLKTSFGSLLSVIINAAPIYYKMEYRGIVAVISDVTGINTVRRKMELLTNLVENAQYDMIFILKPDGQIMECNFLARSSFGYSQSEMLSLDTKALFKFRVDEVWEKIVDAIEQFSRWRGELIAISKEGTEFPVEMTVSRPATKADNSATMICFARDITERKQAEEAKVEAQANSQRIEQLEQEIRSLEQFSSSTQTAATAETFGLKPLRESLSDTFHELVQGYGELMDLTLEQQVYKVEHNISKRLNSMTEQLGFLKAGPRDVVDIHSTALKEKSRGVTPQKAQAYAEEGRLMVLQLMGYLVSYYRNYPLGIREDSAPETSTSDEVKIENQENYNKRRRLKNGEFVNRKLSIERRES